MANINIIVKFIAEELIGSLVPIRSKLPELSVEVTFGTGRLTVLTIRKVAVNSGSDKTGILIRARSPSAAPES